MFPFPCFHPYMTFRLFTQMFTPIGQTDWNRFWDQPVLSIFHTEGHVSQHTPHPKCPTDFAPRDQVVLRFVAALSLPLYLTPVGVAAPILPTRCRSLFRSFPARLLGFSGLLSPSSSARRDDATRAHSRIAATCQRGLVKMSAACRSVGT